LGSNLNPPAGGKWVSHWGGIIQSYELEPSSEAEAFKAAIDADVDVFETHKEDVLAVLLDACDRGPKTDPIDKENAWHRLTRVAWQYFWRKRVDQKTRPAKDRSKRLSKIATVLTKAHRVFDDAKQDTLIDELYSAWCDLNIKAVPDGRLEIVRLRDEFDKVLAAFPALESAALRALERGALSTKPGPDPVLPAEFILVLADEYLKLTERIPGAGQGPFYRFVMQFRAATDPSYKTKDEAGDERVDESLIDDIKKALRFWRRGRGHSAK
jgi:hypothetical protein